MFFLTGNIFDSYQTPLLTVESGDLPYSFVLVSFGVSGTLESSLQMLQVCHLSHDTQSVN